MAKDKELKLIIIGNDGIGKTSLLIRYLEDTYPSEYVPTVNSFFPKQCYLENLKYNYSVMVWDSNGSEEYDQLRPYAYPNTEVILLCFSVDSRDSYEAISKKFYPEIQKNFLSFNMGDNQQQQQQSHTAVPLQQKPTPLPPILLVCTKVEKRNNSISTDIITEDEGMNLAKKVGACQYIEVSSKENINVVNLFNEAVLACDKILAKSKGDQKCNIQ